MASETITQNQYNEIKALIGSNSLAGIKDPTLESYLPLINSENNETFTFSFSGLGSEGSGSNKRNLASSLEIIIKSDLSVSPSLKLAFIPELTENLSNQSIISIKTDGYQENLAIGDGLKIENGALKADSNKIWFDVRAIGDVYLTEEQYNTLVSYAKNDLLAGINANGFFIPLQGISDIKSDKPTLTFEGWYLSIGLITITINSEDRKVDFIAKSVLMSPTTSPSSQVIPSIKTDGSQQNLTVGDGLEIKNGALKTNIPALPSDASTKTYVLKAVNGILT